MIMKDIKLTIIKVLSCFLSSPWLPFWQALPRVTSCRATSTGKPQMWVRSPTTSSTTNWMTLCL